MKRVSFEVAKAIKDAGYPQDVYGHHYYLNGVSCYGALEDNNIFAPTYLELWLWLWREKDICLDIHCPTQREGRTTCYIEHFSFIPHIEYANDPEEAIIAAIEYLVTNKMI